MVRTFFGVIERLPGMNDGENAAQRGFSVYTISMIILGLLLLSAVCNIKFYFSSRANAAGKDTGAAPAGGADDMPRIPAATDGAFADNPVILVADDDPVNVRALRDCLEQKRWVVKTAAGGAGAVDMIGRDRSIDLVLLGIAMGDMSGLDACRRIRRDRSPDELPVIMLTAGNRMSDIDEAYEAGANDYIMKPFRICELLARVSTMLKLRSMRKPGAGGLTVRSRNRTYSLEFGGIIHITSHAKNIVIHTDGEDIEVPILMKEIIGRLPSDIFVRIHKSHIINIRYVYSVSHVQSGRYRVRLRDEDDTVLPVGPAFLEELRKRI